ncbi:MAG TPA: hypothetical protein PKD90_09050 [Phnomibacter sp.]|nr:hypothetical protein [Phnomibacter sp.]
MEQWPGVSISAYTRSLIALALGLASMQVLQGQPFKLAPPLVEYASVFFKDTLPIAVRFKQPGAHTHFTTNGKLPSRRSPVLQQGITISQTTLLTLQNRGKGYRPSPTVTVEFIMAGLPVEDIRFSPPHPNYPGQGPTTLHNLLGGQPAPTSPTWLGYRQAMVELELRLTYAQPIQLVMVHMLQQPAAWIFLPDSIQIFNAHNLLAPLATWYRPARPSSNTLQPVYITLPPATMAQSLVVRLYPIQQLPLGHAGAGLAGWLFIDEAMVFGSQ